MYFVILQHNEYYVDIAKSILEEEVL